MFRDSYGIYIWVMNILGTLHTLSWVCYIATKYQVFMFKTIVNFNSLALKTLVLRLSIMCVSVQNDSEDTSSVRFRFLCLIAYQLLLGI